MQSFLRANSPNTNCNETPVTVINEGHVFDKTEMIIRNIRCKEGALYSYLDENVRCCHDLLLEALRLSPDAPFLGSHATPSTPYSWMSFQGVYERVLDFGSGLINVCGLKASATNCLGIYGQNSLDWIISEFACFTYSFIAVPLYDTLGMDPLKHICSHAELSVCVCVTPDRVRNLLKLGSPLLKHIIITEPDDTLADLRSEVADRVQIHTVSDILERGKENRQKVQPSGPAETAVICYTSGTTGLPKGVIVTNQMLIGTITGCMMNTELKLFTSKDVHLSYLPLAHIFEQFIVLLALNARGRVGFFAGDLTQLQMDAYTLQPTVFIAVPRVLARIKQKINRSVSGSRLKGYLLKTAIQQKLKVVDKQVYNQNTMWDQLVFSKIRKRFGGRIRVIISAGAPITGELLQFTRAVFCCPVLEGYGSTETCGAITASIFGDLNGGHVGSALPNCELKLADIPDLQLVASRDNKGEVCCRGIVVTPGYYKDPELTKTVIDEDGWIHTGDVGIWTDAHCLKIVDRLKHIFKLSQGEYVAPEKLEQVYQTSNLVSQIFVDGNTLRSYPVALVVPEGEALIKIMSSLAPSAKNSIEKKPDSGTGDGNGELGSSSTRAGQAPVAASGENCVFQLPGGKEVTLEELCHLPDVENIVLQDLISVGKACDLKGFELVHAIMLISEPFSVENRLLTPTMKCARHSIRSRYQAELAELFASKKLD